MALYRIKKIGALQVYRSSIDFSAKSQSIAYPTYSVLALIKKTRVVAQEYHGRLHNFHPSASHPHNRY